MQIKFPWEKIEVGQSVFVPCIDAEKVRERGLRAAIPYDKRFKAVIGLKDGFYGVLFTRLR
jgi:hypothetical protein